MMIRWMGKTPFATPADQGFFFNFVVPHDFLRPLIPSPLQLDALGEQTLVSFLFTKSPMGSLDFPVWEVLSQTYVSCEGRRGLYYLSRETSHPLALCYHNLFTPLKSHWCALSLEQSGLIWNLTLRRGISRHKKVVQAKVLEIHKPLLFSDRQLFPTLAAAKEFIFQRPLALIDRRNRLEGWELAPVDWHVSVCSLEWGDFSGWEKTLGTPTPPLDSLFYVTNRPYSRNVQPVAKLQKKAKGAFAPVSPEGV